MAKSSGNPEWHAAYLRAKPIIMALELPVFANAEEPLPLEIGVHEDLSSLVGTDVARDFLRLWTSRREYRKALILGASRYTLHGVESGSVSQEHLEHKKTKVKKQTIGTMRARIKHKKYQINKFLREGRDPSGLERKLKHLLAERERIRQKSET